MDSIRTRRLTSSDALALGGLFARNNIGDVTLHFHPFPLSEASARQLAREADSSPDLYGVAWLDDAIVGFYMLRGWSQGFAVPSFGVLVDRTCQGRGLGRRLTAQALDDARARGAERVRLTVNASNTKALELYRSLGFAEVDQRDDGGQRVLVMICELPT
jgi:ribosomal protein S18 acetylase RimI-like enzyme